MAKKNKLSIYLMKNGVNRAEDIFNDENILELHSFNSDGVYYAKQYINSPGWVRTFFHSNSEELQQVGSQVVLIRGVNINGENRTFALTFGYAKHLLKQDSIEDRFGLKVVLNSIGNNEIRKLSKTCIGTNQKRTEEQLPKGSNIDDFGFDIVRDLIKGVSGKTNEPLFDKGMISGYDSLSVSVNRDINNIDDFLIECYKRYKMVNYKTNFKWLDNITAVKHNKALIEKLENKLFNEIKIQNFENVWMAVPDVLNWDEVGCFMIANDKNTYDDIEIEKVIKSFRNDFDCLSKLKNKQIKAMSSKDTNRVYASWSAFNCLVGEISLDDHQYCISEGKWYEINKQYVEEIEQDYKKICLLDEKYPCYVNAEGEDSYNSKLKSFLFDSVEMHKELINIGGGSGNSIEFCDLYQKDTFIHIKRNTGSGALSHLFNQGLVSAKSLLYKDIYSDFYTKASRRKKDQKSNCDISKSLSRNNSTIVFGIINRFKSERPKIPFFSKVSLCYVAKEIELFGYNLKLKNIEIKENGV